VFPAVSVTFDNLGEAAELEGGVWPDDRPLGRHFSVVDVLPRLLELLERHRLSATFFVEGINADINEPALRRIRDAGHEVACHAWRHENWAELDPREERTLLARCRDALGAVGFRPPGGRLTGETPGLLRELGYRYCSPAGERAGLDDDLAVLPFRWPLLDAYYYLPNFEGLRERNGDGADTMPPAALRDALLRALDEHAAGGGHLPLLFHPFLMTVSDDAVEVLDDVLARVRALADDGPLRCVRMDEAASWMLEHADEVPDAPVLDESSWMA
jgi:peptidoglycan/xylan/chitin deacetylase (PgdA/CDA1 family)